MRNISKTVNGYKVYAVSGVNTISFAIDSKKADTKGLLGFAVERSDAVENERYFMYGFKVFEEVLPNPTKETKVSTFNHPVQSFVWDDFTCKPGREYKYFFYPLKGKPKNIDRSSPPVEIEISTEPLYSTDNEHDVFFNRGVASSQAYSRQFNNVSPDKMQGAEKEKALAWLGRDLPGALLKFIGQAKKGDSLWACFYEFRFPPVAEAFKAAIERGANVKIIFDAKDNQHMVKGKLEPSFPRIDNLKVISDAKLPKANVISREARPDKIQHNKFIILQKKGEKTPSQLWTGSTNISQGGIYGQTNVGHWVRNSEVAKKYKDYWDILADDPGGTKGGTDNTKKNNAFKTAVAAIQPDLESGTLEHIPKGVTTIFSPRPAINMLNNYASMVDGAVDVASITLAFGVNKTFKDLLLDNTNKNAIIFMLQEKEDVKNPRSKEEFIALNAGNNVYSAWGSYLAEPFYEWVRAETNTRKLKQNSHVAYIHSKFLLMDPLGKDPVVVSGSANFSDASTKENDENMIIVRGNKRVADIYFTEFNRLFNHYYFRAIAEKTSNTANARPQDGFYLEPDDGWLKKYKPGSLKTKRVGLFTKMVK